MPSPASPNILPPLICPCDACGSLMELACPLYILLSVYTHHHFLFCNECDALDIPPMNTNVH